MRRALLTVLSLAWLLCSCAADTVQTEHSMQREQTDVTKSPFTEKAYPVDLGAPAASEAEEVRVSMSFAGACRTGSSFGEHEEGSYNRYADDHPPEYFLGRVQSVFSTDDITVVGCESVLTDSISLEPILKEGDPSWYCGPASNAYAFSEGSVEMVGVANDHTGDYGDHGYADTVKALADAGIVVGEDMKPVYYEVNGVTVGLLCCNCRNADEASLVRAQLEVMSESSDVQVVFPNSGTINTYIPDEWMVEEFRSFIDAGADVVAAGHSHSLQPLEKYKDGIIAYSLGSFICDGNTLRHNVGVILSVTAVFSEGEYYGIEYEVIPCYLYTTGGNNYRPETISPRDPAYNRIVEFMYRLRPSPLIQ